MNKHTPGPWVAYRCHRHGYNVFAKTEAGEICVIDAQDYEGRYGAIGDEANARLIAATPDLLEALKFALKELGGTDPYDLAYEDGTCGYIRGIIAKAEGEQP